MEPEKQQRIPSTSSRPRVVVIGAGIAGLSVAHELARTGRYDVEVIERRPCAGGKARTEWQQHRFREHSMRILPGSYVCMHQILAEIETPHGKAIERLRPAMIVFHKGERRTEVQGRYAGPSGCVRYLADAVRLLWFLNRAGVSLKELVVFIYKVFSLLRIPDRKVILDLSRLKFSEYLNGGRTSPGFDNVIFRVAEILVAAKSYASASVVSSTLLEWFVTPFLVGKYVRHGVSEFDSPTSDALIDPWVAWLQKSGVRFRFGETTTAIEARAGRIVGIQILRGEETETVHADAYVLAVQHNVASALLSPRLRRYVPELDSLPQLGEEWAHSVQFLVDKLMAPLNGLEGRSVAVIDSPWSIGYKVYSKASWNGRSWQTMGLTDDEAIVTMTISNSVRPGVLYGLPLLRCTREQILKEVLAQTRLGDVLDVRSGELGLDIAILSEEEIDEDSATYAGYGVAAIGTPGENLVFVSDSLMYIRLPGNLDIEPHNATAVYNLFLAGEYTRTNYGIPTMEKSCESGKRCAQAILAGFGMPTDPERVPECDLPLRFLRTEVFRIALRFLLWGAVVGVLGWLALSYLSR